MERVDLVLARGGRTRWERGGLDWTARAGSGSGRTEQRRRARPGPGEAEAEASCTRLEVRLPLLPIEVRPWFSIFTTRGGSFYG